MNTDSLLVPLDLTGCAAEVVEVAGDLAKKLDAHVILMTVVTVPAGLNTHAPVMLDDHELHTALQALDEDAVGRLTPLRDQLRAKGVTVRHAIAHGDVTNTILATAESVNCGMIVMGTHGRRGLERLVFGSVAEQVLRRSCCPVLVVRGSVPTSQPHKSEVELQLEAEADG